MPWGWYVSFPLFGNMWLHIFASYKKHYHIYSAHLPKAVCYKGYNLTCLSKCKTVQYTWLLVYVEWPLSSSYTAISEHKSSIYRNCHTYPVADFKHYLKAFYICDRENITFPGRRGNTHETQRNLLLIWRMMLWLVNWTNNSCSSGGQWWWWMRFLRLVNLYKWTF